MEINAITPVRRTLAAPQTRTDTVTTVNKLADGTHKVSQDHYTVTLYDRGGSLQTVQRSFSTNYLV